VEDRRPDKKRKSTADLDHSPMTFAEFNREDFNTSGMFAS
jgi:hypothetical protein